MDLPQLPILDLLLVWRGGHLAKDSQEEDESTEGVKKATYKTAKKKETTDADITIKDLYRAQYDWDEVGLARLDVSRRVELCTALVRIISAKCPDLADSSIFGFWKEIIENPSAVRPQYNYDYDDY